MPRFLTATSDGVTRTSSLEIVFFVTSSSRFVWSPVPAVGGGILGRHSTASSANAS